MKIAIVAPSPVPFLVGGAEKLFLGLHYHINRLTSHEAESIKVPCRDQDFWTLMEAYHRFSRMDLGHFDMLITTKYPAWMTRHHNHHVYMQHPCRGVYDLYHLSGRPAEFVPGHKELKTLAGMLEIKDPDRSMLEPFFRELFRLRDPGPASGAFAFPGPLTRAIIRWLDRIALSPQYIKGYCAISRNVSRREGYFPRGVDIEVIYHPSALDGLYSSGYKSIFTASRFEKLKRLDLLLMAFKSTDADIELRIAGAGGQEERWKKMAGGDRRIRFLGFISDAGLVRQYAEALFVPFIPYDEDYGLITVEAMQSAKAVLTTTDSGGVKELVTDGFNGMVVAPDADSLAGAMTRLIADRANTIQMGRKAQDFASHINWPNTVSRLLRQDEGGTGRRHGSPAAPRPKMVVATTFRVWPPLSGGKKRIFHLYKELSEKADIVLVTMTSSHPATCRKEIAPHLAEISITMSDKHLRRERALSARLAAPAGDIAAIKGYAFTPEFLAVLSRECREADVVIASHPYLYYAIREVYPGRLWYEAHNVEYDLKRMILPASPETNEYLEMVRTVERECCCEAELIMAVSREDALRLEQLYRADRKKITIIPNGMDFSSARENTLSGRKRQALRERLGLEDTPVCLFIGSYHGPNIEALKRIKEIAVERPDLVFLVAGSVCDCPEAADVPANVKTLGLLDEAEKAVALNAAHLGLNPVESGSGSNLKLLEYVAYGLPVLTTPFGMRGYEFKAEEHLLMAPAAEFPVVLKKHRPGNAGPLQDMAERALAFAASRYDWSSIARGLSERIGQKAHYMMQKSHRPRPG